MTKIYSEASGGSSAPFPRMVLSAPLSGYDVTLARSEKAVIALRALQAVPGALTFTLQILSAPGLDIHGRSSQKADFSAPSTGQFSVEARFADSGTRGSDVQRVHAEVLSGGGGMGRWDISYWFRLPDPVAAETGIAVEWQDAGILPTLLNISRDDILKASPEEISFHQLNAS
jgi:hypothetical protein